MPTITSIEPSYTGTRECRCSRSPGRISVGVVLMSRQTMSVRGTMTARTGVSSSSNTLWIISRSSRSTTPSLAPTSTRVRSSSSVSIAWSTRSRPMSRTVRSVSPVSTARTGRKSTPSHATGRPASARNRSGYFTARVIGSTSPNVVRMKTSTTIWTISPQRWPKRSSAIVAASAAAPMLMTVIPTSSVTSRSCARPKRGFAGSPSGVTRLSRARPSEKYAASAPVRMAEQTMSTASSQSRSKMLSGTRAPRHEVLEPRAHRHDLPAGVEVADALRGADDFADGGEACPGRACEAVGQTVERPGLAREQKLVVFTAPGRPDQGVAPQHQRDGMHRGVDGNPSQLHAGAHPALLADMAEVGGEPVREVHHRGDASGLREPLPRTRSGPGSQVRGRHVGEDVGRNSRRRLRRLQNGQAGRRAAERSRDGDDVADARGGSQDGWGDRLAEQRHVDDPAPGGSARIAADDHDVLLGGERLEATVERLGLVHLHGLGARESDQRPAGPSAHRGDVRDVHRERLPPDVGRVRPAAPEVNVFDEKVGRRQKQALAAELENGAIVADADANPGRPPDRASDDLDQTAFGWSAWIRSTDAVPAGSELGERVQLRFELGARHRADHLIGDLALLHEEDRRDRANPVARGKARVLVDIHFGERDTTRRLLRQVLEDRRDCFTRSAPLGPEVHHHEPALSAQCLIEILLGQVDGSGIRHVVVSSMKSQHLR